MLDQVVSVLKDIAATAVSSLIVGLIIFLWTALKAYIRAKIEQIQSETDNAKMKQFLEGIKLICSDVSASFDPIAEQLKAANSDGKLTKEEIEQLQKDSLSAAICIIKGLFSEELLEKFGITETTMEEWCYREIESSLQERKAKKMLAQCNPKPV